MLLLASILAGLEITCWFNGWLYSDLESRTED